MSFRIDTKLQLRHKVDLSHYTTMHVGGCADFFAEPQDDDELIEALEFARHEKIPYLLLGRGSNILFSDEGFRGLIVSMNRFGTAQIHFDLESPTVCVSAGVQLYRFALACKEQGLGGVEFLSTIPGSVGGAVVMNAGFSRHPGQRNETGDLIEEVTVLTDSGKKCVLQKQDLIFSYRTSNLKGKIITHVKFHLWRRAKTDIENEIRANFDYRAREQDVRYPSSGSIFKNPPGSESAGKIIDRLGLKGFQVGQAMVSPQHANYMVNLGKARFSDFLELIEHVKKVVRNATGILLETEVILFP